MSTKSTPGHPPSAEGARMAAFPREVRELLTLLPPIFYALRSGPPAPALHQLVRRLGPRHFPALMLIAAQQPLTVGELAVRLHFSLATTSQLVSDLDRAGLVSRNQDPADRRRTLVTVSDQSATAVAQWYAGRAEPVQRALGQLTPLERRTLIKSLGILGDELARSGAPGPADERS